MKKLLVVALVMLMASMANAVMLELSVNGQITPGQAVVELEPSGTFVLDIYDSQGYTTGQDGYIIAMADLYVSSIDGANAFVLPGHLDTGLLGSNQELADLGFVGKTGILAFVGFSGAGLQTWAPGTVIDGIQFHCDVFPGDTVVELLWTADFGEWTVLDSIMVHQIPEPMTMSLLGLGALLIRRK